MNASSRVAPQEVSCPSIYAEGRFLFFLEGLYYEKDPREAMAVIIESKEENRLSK